jgi:hypothetical protein
MFFVKLQFELFEKEIKSENLSEKRWKGNEKKKKK